MKIAILSCANLSRAQYIYKYLHLLDKYDCQYDVIYWNRTLEEVDIDCNANFISFDEYIDSYKKFHQKITDYIRFATFVNKTVKQNKYDKLIILTTPMAVCVLPLCFGRYKGKYLFDFRDLTKEYIYLYKKVVQKIARNSELFATSSPGYLEYFPETQIDNYVLCHNTLSEIAFKKECEISRKDVIRVSYWGAIRQVEYNKRICEIFGNDDRFEFYYHGDGAYVELDHFCREKGYNNIHFTGRYALKDIKKFASETDILFNAYETDFVTTPSLAVKVYDSVEYRLPLIVSEGSFMEKYLKGSEFTFVFKLRESILDEMYTWYKNLGKLTLDNSFYNVFRQVKRDDEIFEDKLRRFVGVQ